LPAQFRGTSPFIYGDTIELPRAASNGSVTARVQGGIERRVLDLID